MPLLQSVQHLFALTVPLFLLVLIGYVLSRWGKWPRQASDALSRFVFSVAVPALLFRLMSNVSHLPPVDARLLIAYFGSCLVVFFLGRLTGRWLFKMDGVSQSIFGLGGIFSNNVLLGVPLAKIALGEKAIPSVSLIIVFNALLLWTLVTVSVEWARNRSATLAGFAQTAIGVVANPVVAGILSGAAFSFTGWTLPAIADQTLNLISQAAVPLSLIALGMGLAEFGIWAGWRESTTICVLKLAVQPLIVLMLARLLVLPPVETQAIVMMASLPVGANVYLMSRQFDTLGGVIAASLVLSTSLSALTTPLMLVLTGVSEP